MGSRAVAYAVTRRQDAPAPRGGTGKNSSSERAGCRGPRWATSRTVLRGAWDEHSRGTLAHCDPRRDVLAAPLPCSLRLPTLSACGCAAARLPRTPAIMGCRRHVSGDDWSARYPLVKRSP